MTFALRNAAQVFQRFLDSVYRDLPYCFVYIDDIIITSHSLDEHIIYLKEMFRRLTENGLVLKISKCIFAKPEVDSSDILFLQVAFVQPQNAFKPFSISIDQIQLSPSVPHGKFRHCKDASKMHCTGFFAFK
ncbi:hypothetical protein TNCV_3778441 [Trichonephila clavipes]|nr:hypothetical protein TNCV_3778441 [Trichonephila clavipes]